MVEMETSGWGERGEVSSLTIQSTDYGVWFGTVATAMPWRCNLILSPTQVPTHKCDVAEMYFLERQSFRVDKLDFKFQPQNRSFVLFQALIFVGKDSCGSEHQPISV